MSYPLMTPSAARGVLDAILFKPQMRWHVRRITVLEPWWLRPEAYRPDYRLLGIRRNEIQGKISPRTVQGWMAAPSTFEPYLADSAGRKGAGGQNRTQRNTLALRNVAYLIHATPLLTDRANKPRVKPPDSEEPNGPDSIAKYVDMFRRRVEKGWCFHRPYLGCREFACNFAPPDGKERPVRWSEQLGLMLYDLRYGEGGDHQPLFFQAEVTNGVLHCDTRDTGPNGESPVKLYGVMQEVTA